MSDIKSVKVSPVINGGVIVNRLANDGWIIKKPVNSPDSKHFLVRCIPPIFDNKIRFLILCGTKEKLYIIAIGEKWNVLGTEMVDDINALELVEVYLNKARDGESEQLSNEISAILACIPDED